MSSCHCTDRISAHKAVFVRTWALATRGLSELDSPFLFMSEPTFMNISRCPLLEGTVRPPFSLSSGQKTIQSGLERRAAMWRLLSGLLCHYNIVSVMWDTITTKNPNQCIDKSMQRLCLFIHSFIFYSVTLRFALKVHKIASFNFKTYNTFLWGDHGVLL